jgi:2-phospho-L-lactate guanylyltransferase
MKVSALIPIKGFRNAKQRLSSVLGPGEREMLAAVMFRDVLRQALKTHGLAETFVVTGDDQAAEIAKTLGAKVIREKSENGETDAVDFARVELKRMGREAVLILPGDMPLIRSGDIEQLLAQVPEGATPPFALLVPSHDHLGTNALLLAPADLIKLRFGYDSFSYHMSQVAAHGLPLRFIENERIALDIDEPRDLERFLSVEIADGESARVARGMLADQAAEKSHSSGGL